MSDYEPGTVAVATVGGVPNVRVFRAKSDTFPWASAQRARDDFFHRDEMVTDVRPLVVLDLAEFDLRVIAASLRTMGFRTIADQIEAQAKPPRIPEPGLWGVVRDPNGTTFVKEAEIILYRWHPLGSESNVKWDEIESPILVREGIA